MEEKSIPRSRTVYTFNEISQLYFPDLSKKSASKRLKVWINRNEKLLKEMLEAGYTHGARYITPRQRSIIYAHLGEPEGID